MFCVRFCYCVFGMSFLGFWSFGFGGGARFERRSEGDRVGVGGGV